MKTTSIFLLLFASIGLTTLSDGCEKKRPKKDDGPKNIVDPTLVNVNFSPEINGKLTYQPIEPRTPGEPAKAALSIGTTIFNLGTDDIQLTGIRVITDQFERLFVPPLVYPDGNNCCNINPITPGVGFYYQNSRDYNEIGDLIIMEAPFPTSVRIELSFLDGDPPLVYTRELIPYPGHLPGQNYQWPFFAEDLGLFELWHTDARHGGGIQVFAMDLGMQGWDGTKWNEFRPGTDGSKNEDYRCYGRRVYAMADGYVDDFQNDLADNSKPGVIDPDNGGGNYIRIVHGTDTVLYTHLMPKELNKDLLSKGAPVKKGQFLGRVGNSGNSLAPHLHIDAIRQLTPGGGAHRPMLFEGADYVAVSEYQRPVPKAKWSELEGATTPSDWCFIRPTVGTGWGEYTRFGVKAADFQKEFDRLDAAGHYPVWIDGYEVNGKSYFNIIFRPTMGIPWAAFHGLTGDSYQLHFNKYDALGYRLLFVDSYLDDGQVRYNCVFRKDGGPRRIAYHGWEANRHQLQFEAITPDGWVPINIAVVRKGGLYYFTAIYEQLHQNFVHHGALTAAQYQGKWDEYAEAGMQLGYVNAFMDGGTPKFSAIWYKTPPYSSARARHGMTGAQFQVAFDDNLKAGRFTRCVTGYERNNKSGYAALWTPSY